MYCVGFQLAVNVCADGVDTMLDSVIVLLFKLHPLKSYPVFVGVGRVPYAWSNVTDLVVGSTVPPFGLNVTVYSFAVHCAIRSVSSVIDTVSVDVYVLSFSSFHPSNV